MPNTHRLSTVELRRVGGVYAPVVSRDPVSNFLRQSHIGCRIVNWVTTVDGCVHITDTTQLDSTRQLRGGVYWALDDPIEQLS